MGYNVITFYRLVMSCIDLFTSMTIEFHFRTVVMGLQHRWSLDDQLTQIRDEGYYF